MATTGQVQCSTTCRALGVTFFNARIARILRPVVSQERRATLSVLLSYCPSLGCSGLTFFCGDCTGDSSLRKVSSMLEEFIAGHIAAPRTRMKWSLKKGSNFIKSCFCFPEMHVTPASPEPRGGSLSGRHSGQDITHRKGLVMLGHFGQNLVH